MTSFSLRDIDCPEKILVLQNELNLRQAISNFATARQMRSLVQDIEKSLISIQHKLNVAMYQGGLICNLNPDHFTLFIEQPDPAKRELLVTDTLYKLCMYEMHDDHEFRLCLSFFIETFSATIFSLLDVVGHLLKDLYELSIPAHQVSFNKMIEAFKTKRPSDKLYDFLQIYQPNSPVPTKPQHANEPWVDPLTKIRNITTHRLITDVCDAQLVRRSGIYNQLRSQKTQFLLDQSLFPTGTSDVELCHFVKDVFAGIQQFVEELYDRLRQAVEQSKQIPIY